MSPPDAAAGVERFVSLPRLPRDDGSRYYEHWLAALEALVTAKKLAEPAALLERKEAWADAYRHTPHGQPVKLGADELVGDRRCRSRRGFDSLPDQR